MPALGRYAMALNLPSWLRKNLVTVGAAGRLVFQDKMIDLLSEPTTLADIKVAWNGCMDTALGEVAATHFDEP
jgi:hypothetical protein